MAFLSDRGSYADRPRTVEVIETHYSWIFMTEDHVYKLKKRVKGPFFDFTTAELRRRNCETELRLNRRLAPRVYRGIVPLTLDAGRLGFGGGVDGVGHRGLLLLVGRRAHWRLHPSRAKQDQMSFGPVKLWPRTAITGPISPCSWVTSAWR